MLTVDFRLLGIRDGERVLDAGCGEGRHAFQACKLNHCSVYALDICRESLQKVTDMLHHMNLAQETKGEASVVQGDAMNLPFKDGCFDKIICSEVLEHLSDDGQGIGELVRVLKRDGSMAVTVPTYITEAIYWKLSRDYHTNPGGHIRKYRPRQLINLLRKNNLRIYAIRHEHAFDSIYWLLRCSFGIKNEKALIPSLCYRFLVRRIIMKGRFIRFLERLGNLFFPKSIIIYTRKIPSH